MNQGKFFSLTVFLMVFLLSACGGGGGSDDSNPPPAEVDFSGVWRATTSDTGCGDVNVVENELVSIEQNGNSATFSTDEGEFTANVSGSTASWSREYPEDDGTTNESGSLTMTSESVSGSTDWTHTDSDGSCDGTTDFTLACVSGACLVNTSSYRGTFSNFEYQTVLFTVSDGFIAGIALRPGEEIQDGTAVGGSVDIENPNVATVHFPDSSSFTITFSEDGSFSGTWQNADGSLSGDISGGLEG